MATSIENAKILASSTIRNFVWRGYFIHITDIALEEDLLRVCIDVSKNGKYIFVDNPLYYGNPPIIYFDGKKYIKDPDRSLKEIITQTVELTGK
jgi:hypothetical protein